MPKILDHDDPSSLVVSRIVQDAVAKAKAHHGIEVDPAIAQSLIRRGRRRRPHLFQAVVDNGLNWSDLVDSACEKLCSDVANPDKPCVPGNPWHPCK